MIAVQPHRADLLKYSRQRRTRRRVNRVILIFILLLILTFSFLIAINQPRWQITTIKIFNPSNNNSTEIKRVVEEILFTHYYGLIKKSNRWLYPKTEIRDRLLASWPNLEEIGLSYQPRTNVLIIKLTERRASLIWCQQLTPRQCQFADAKGIPSIQPLVFPINFFLRS